ncbi:MAG: WG repeat-containing protein, partial [Deltaproteobacteria bacterium]|nr:WG repeat-containing protein [Deltaproteobacteria bacterium]
MIEPTANGKWSRLAALLALAMLLCAAPPIALARETAQGRGVLLPARPPGRGGPAASLYGYIDQNGEWAIAPRFQAANPFQPDGTAWVRLNDDYGLIDRSGQFVVGPFAAPMEIGEPQGGALSPAQGPDGEWGFMDGQGHWAIRPSFSEAKAFGAGDLAPVANGDFRWGYVDASGRYAIPPRFASAGPFSASGVAQASPGPGRLGLIDAKGRWLVQPDISQLDEPSADGFSRAELTDGKIGLLDGQGQWSIK